MCSNKICDASIAIREVTLLNPLQYKLSLDFVLSGLSTARNRQYDFVVYARGQVNPEVQRANKRPLVQTLLPSDVEHIWNVQRGKKQICVPVDRRVSKRFVVGRGHLERYILHSYLNWPETCPQAVVQRLAVQTDLGAQSSIEAYSSEQERAYR